MMESDKCIRDKRLCPTLCPNNFKNLPEPASQGSLMELRTHALARWGRGVLQPQQPPSSGLAGIGSAANHRHRRRCQPPCPPCCPHRYYGFTSFSHGTLVHGLLRDRWHSRLNMSECELFSTLYKDMVHPSDTGRLLMVSGTRLLMPGHCPPLPDPARPGTPRV